MNTLNLVWFQWLAAGPSPAPWLLPIAVALARGGPWLCVALLGWAAWRRPSERAYAMAVLLAAAAAALLAHGIAERLNLPRPFMLGLSPAYIAHGTRGTLPSAHASVMFTVALILLARPRLRMPGLAIAAIAVLTGWARVYVGVHFPLDIAAGLLLAAGVACVFALLQWFYRRHLAPIVARDGFGRAPGEEPRT